MNHTVKIAKTIFLELREEEAKVLKDFVHQPPLNTPPEVKDILADVFDNLREALQA